MRWGLVPSWAKDPSIGSRLINARMETVTEKPAFRRAFAKRRCLLPADGYYEWYGAERGKKQPFYITRRDGRPLAMAGLYEFWRAPDADPEDRDAWLVTCTVLTTTAEDDVGRIHDRMPLMVPPDRWAEWLDPANDDTDAAAGPAGPGGPGRARGVAGGDAGQQREEQRAGAGAAARGGRRADAGRRRRPADDGALF